jgi:UDP-N-acetylmuramyl pentapeptide phosphotransferase/UDP-N-acetylglucosamine-1-phosphate transferase
VFGDFDKYISVFLTGFVVVYLLTPVVRFLARRYGVIDLPNERRPHKQPTARGGGVAIVLGVQAACLVALYFPWPDMAGDFDLHWWRRFVAASMVLLVVGVIDDVRGMKPLIKLAGQAAAALLMTYGGTQFGQFFGMHLPAWLDHFLVVIWILAVINAFNLIDGLDGLASGLACISAVGLCGIFIIGKLPGNVLVLMGLIGACLAFLRYNLHPASIFLGDTGSMFLGFMLGTISLDTCTKNTFLLSLTIPMLVLGVPIYDTILAIWRRSVRRMWVQDDGGGSGRKRGIMQPDLDHLHHRLLKAGLSTRRVAIVLCVGNAGLVLFGLMVTTFESHAAGIFLIALLAGVYVLMRHLAIIELRDTGAALLRGLRRPTPITFKALGYPAWDMTAMAGAVAIAKWLSEDDYTPSFWYDWFLSLPVWLTPTFALLAVSRTYITIWSRARMRDVLILFLTLQAGLLLSLGLALVIDPYSQIQKSMLYTLVIFAIGHPTIIFLRVAYRLMEELVSWSRSKEQTRPDERRVLLYGTGARCWLLLRELGFSKSENIGGRTIIGMVDDDESLHSRWVYGYLVMGGGKDLPRLITTYKITGIIVTADLTPKSREAVCNLAHQGGIEISEWISSEQIIVPRPALSKSVVELESKPVS